ncbi:hypothetical protein PNEG_03442 [Pneumocystis murina B123]|uniref:Ribosomal protein S11 n=1 Tax=Pneumocystis murina (strain B123) TaxID=1069680 RepID=M7NM62_PNEMU|nr:hypothetical protein PNEG_03442 [Pneumocystis murina B123]EMR08277.1 hypothetical protein PNEG_03442 [Pneumocystis murina B123]
MLILRYIIDYKQLHVYFLNKSNIFCLNLPLRIAFFSHLSLIYKDKFKIGNLADLDKFLIKANDTDSSRKEDINESVFDEDSSISLDLNPKSSLLSNTFTEIINKPFHYNSSQTKEKIYHLHAYCSDNNTIITLTNSHYNPVICISSGMVGFKKAQRGGYEAGYQVCMSLFKKMMQKDIYPTQFEIILRGFGKGREAIFKCVNGIEGLPFKSSVSRITDATRINFGGVRGRKVRRL